MSTYNVFQKFATNYWQKILVDSSGQEVVPKTLYFLKVKVRPRAISSAQDLKIVFGMPSGSAALSTFMP